MLTKEYIKRYLQDANNFFETVESCKDYISYTFVNEIEKAIQEKTETLDSREQEKQKEKLFFEIVKNYYLQEKNISFYPNTSENRKKCFTLDNIFELMDKKRDIITYSDWLIKYDHTTQKVVDITTYGCVNMVSYKKDFEKWILNNPQYLKNEYYYIYELIVNIDDIIKEYLQEQKENIIVCDAVMQDDTTQKVIFKKYSSNHYTSYTAYTENKNYFVLSSIKSINNKDIPIFQNATKLDFYKLCDDDFIKKHFDIFLNDAHCNKIKLKNTYTYIEWYSNNFINLHYKNNSHYLYLHNNKLYEYNYYNKSAISCTQSLSKIISGEKTYSIIKKAIQLMQV